MDVITTNDVDITSQVYRLPIDDMMDKCKLMMQRYWDKYPDLYRIVQL